MWTLESLISYSNSCAAKINNKWVPVRPINYFSLNRFKMAWKVLIGKADAFTWPENQ
jgi:hypothetical protein